MEKTHTDGKVLMIGNDARLFYLINRYADQSGLPMASALTLPSLPELQRISPSFIIFSSLEILRSSQPMIANLGDMDIQILVCIAIGEEATAREMGADDCLFHPLTYERFCQVLCTNCES